MALSDHRVVVDAQHTVDEANAEHFGRVVGRFWLGLVETAEGIDEDAAVEIAREFVESTYWDGGEQLNGDDT